jgi:hypothetical protein
MEEMYLADSVVLGHDNTLTYEELLIFLPSSSVVAYNLQKKEAGSSVTSITIYRFP